MSKKTIIRPGDRVRVLRDRFIERVGYPLIYGMFMDEVAEDTRTAEALKVLGWRGEIPYHFQVAVARMRVEQKGFGGRERKIIYEPEGGYGRSPGQVLTVYSKRVAKTGVWFPATVGSRWSDHESDSEPGGLDDCKTHVILRTEAGEIEACDVELV